MTGIDRLRRWIGRERVASETLTPELAQRFEASFDRPAQPVPGDPAPPLVHLCLADPAAPLSGTGRDGHAAPGGFLPPVPLPRRMWAGGAFRFRRILRIGDRVTRRSVISDVAMKRGRSGPLCFVTVTHEIGVAGRVAVEERQDLVYRDRPAPGDAPPPAPPAPPAPHTRRIVPSPTLLFRYSALTFNGHRIHYDRPFAVAEEGYPGLVVHGPLQATLLLHYAAELTGSAPARFDFRSVSPLFDDADFTLNAAGDADGLDLWTARPGGPVAMTARARW